MFKCLRRFALSGIICLIAWFVLLPSASLADIDIKAEVMDFFNSSGISTAVGKADVLLTQASSGSFNILTSAMKPLSFDLNNDFKTVANSMSELAKAMMVFSDKRLLEIFEKFRSVINNLPDVDVGFGFPGGRIEAVKRGMSLSVTAIVRKKGCRMIVGVSNSDPLGAYAGGRLSNPTPGLPYAFIDVNTGPFASFQARMPIAGGLPIIRASAYIEAAGQGFKVEMSAMDLVPTKAKFEIGLGIEATFDAELMVEGEFEGKICFETEPHKAWAYAKPAMAAMSRAAAGMKKVDSRQAGSVLYAGFRSIVEAISRSGDNLGEVGVQVELSAKAGIGAADTSASAGTLKAGLGLMLPLGDAVKLGSGMISDIVEAGISSLPYFHRFASAGAFNNPKALVEFAQSLEQIVTKLSGGIFGKALSASAGSKLVFELSLDALGEDGGSDSATAMRMFGFEAEIPAGKSIQTALKPELIRQLALAILYFQDQLSPKGITGKRSVPEPDWATLASVIPQGTVLEIELSPGIPVLTLGAKFPLSALVDSLKAGASSVMSLLKSLPECVRKGTLEPLADKAKGAFASTTGAVIKEFKKEAEFTLQIGAGFDVSIGAEGAGELGLGAKGFVKTDLEFPCALAGKSYDTPNQEGEASIGLIFDFEGEGKVEPGEFVEIEAGVGVETSHKLFNFTIKEIDTVKPFASDEVMVAGFLVTGYKGTIASTGALNGAGKLHLPVGGAVDATFTTDASGKVTKGSWKGGFSIAGNSFTVASGTIKDDGLHWAAKPNLPFIPASATVDMVLGPDFELKGSAKLAANLLGVSQDYEIGLDISTGMFYGRATSNVKVGPWTFSNSDFRLDNNGISGAGDLAVPGGTSIRWNIRVSTSGTISGHYANSFKIAGWTLSQVSLDIGNDKISGTAYARLPGTGTDIGFNVDISKTMGLSARGGGNITYGSWTLAQADISITDSSFTGSANLGLPGGSSASVNLSGTATSFSAGFGQNLSLFGWNLTNSSLTVSTTKVSGNASVNLPSGPSASLLFSITPTSFSGSVTQDLSMMGWNFTSMKLTMTDTSFTAVGKVDLPGGSKGSADLVLTPTSASGKVTLSSGKLMSWVASAIDFSFSSTSLTGTCKLKLGTTPSYNQEFSVTVTPTHISGSATAAGPTILGWSLASGTLNLSDEQVTGSLLITVPGIGQSQYSVDATPTKFEASYQGSATIYGFNVTSADLKIAGSTMTGSFYLAVPGLTSTKFTVSAGGPSKFEATATGALKVCDWDVADASLKLASTTITGTGNINILGLVNPKFNFTVSPSGASGRYENDITLPLPGGNSVTLDDAVLTLDTANGMRGTGKLKLSNVTLASADYGITKAGGIEGAAFLGLGANNVRCTFKITASGITLNGSMGASASYTINMPYPVPDAVFSLAATVTAGIKNVDELSLTASGTADGPGVDPKTVSGSVDLASGKFSISVFGYTMEFDLF